MYVHLWSYRITDIDFSPVYASYHLIRQTELLKEKSSCGHPSTGHQAFGSVWMANGWSACTSEDAKLLSWWPEDQILATGLTAVEEAAPLDPNSPLRHSPIPGPCTLPPLASSLNPRLICKSQHSPRHAQEPSGAFHLDWIKSLKDLCPGVSKARGRLLERNLTFLLRELPEKKNIRLARAIQKGRNVGEWMMEEAFACCRGSESCSLFSHLGSMDGSDSCFVMGTKWGGVCMIEQKKSLLLQHAPTSYPVAHSPGGNHSQTF